MAREKSEEPEPLSAERWDVAVVGGALSGSAAAIELLKRNAGLRIAIIESNPVHKRRVGESTVEVSSFFLARVLGLSGELNRNHISKQGLRFWFANEETKSFDECSEVGPKFNVLFPGYQIDRARLDEVVLDKAIASGAKLFRPAKAVSFELEEDGIQKLTIEIHGERRVLKARWIVDASGVRAMVARKNGWIRNNEEHPIATIWSRWKNVTDWDDDSLFQEAPNWSKRVYGVRNNATNHLLGKGWWAWWIPLQNGDVSIGIVYDQRLCELPDGESLGDRLGKHLRSHPLGERLLRDATFIKGDVYFRRNISYSSDRFAGDGFALVGDAAGFIDPFYSPGLDWVCYGVMASAKLIAESMEKPKSTTKALKRHNREFANSYQRWFASIYMDKYYYMGDFELMKLAFRLDLGFYYLGAVSRPYILGRQTLTTPSFGQREAKIPAALISFYNRRLATIAKKRISNGRWGRKNANRNFSFFSYRLNWTLPLRLGVAIGSYLWLEFTELLLGFGGASKTGKERIHEAKEAVST